MKIAKLNGTAKLWNEPYSAANNRSSAAITVNPLSAIAPAVPLNASLNAWNLFFSVCRWLRNLDIKNKQ